MSQLIHGGKASEHESSEKSEEQQADEILRPLFSGHGGIAKSRRVLIFRRYLRIIGRRSQGADQCEGQERNCAHQGGNNPVVLQLWNRTGDGRDN
jgi:hypothetical protein